MNIFEMLHEEFKFSRDKPLRLFEAFAGYGSQFMALKRLGIEVEVIGYSEIDKYAIQVYEALHGKHKNYGGIGSFDRLPENIDLCTWSFPCFTKETLVLTQRGYKEIIDISVDDMVLTHDNTYKKVLKTFIQGKKETIKIKGMSVDEIITTPNHKFYVREMKRVGHNSVRTFLNPVWKEAKDLTKKDYLGIAINKNQIIPKYNGYKQKYSDGRIFTYDKLKEHMGKEKFWWIVGRYIGDGWLRKQGGIIICDDKNSYKDITNILDGMFSYNVVIEKTVAKIHIPNIELGVYLKRFGRGASNKRLTNDILDLPINLSKSFLEGYLSADGSVDNKGLRRISSVSRELIYGVAHLISKTYHRPYSIYKHIPKSKKEIEGRIVNQKPYYTLQYKLTNDKQDKAFYEDGYVWFPISKIIKNGFDYVYDIEIEKNHSFTANNVIVHNCQDISLAGKQRGMNDETRSNYGYVFLDTVEATPYAERPKVLLMENVRALFSEKFRDDWREIQLRLENLGYSNYSKILNAKDYGVAQNRERVFIVSILGEYYYEFPQPQKLTKRLKDYLEDEVDEKYYLNDRFIEQMTKEVKNYDRKTKFIGGVSQGEMIARTITTKLDRPESNYISIPEATKQGYAEAHDGDGIYINRPHQKRGVVQKGMIQTIKTGQDVGVVIYDDYNSQIRKDQTTMGTITTNIGVSTKRNGYKIIDLKSQPNYSAKPNEEVAPTQYAQEHYGIVENNLRIRKLTPREALRLMDVAENDIDIILSEVSNTQAYKLAGNSIVVNVLVEIFRKLF